MKKGTYQIKIQCRMIRIETAEFIHEYFSRGERFTNSASCFVIENTAGIS